VIVVPQSAPFNGGDNHVYTDEDDGYESVDSTDLPELNVEHRKVRFIHHLQPLLTELIYLTLLGQAAEIRRQNQVC